MRHLTMALIVGIWIATGVAVPVGAQTAAPQEMVVNGDAVNVRAGPGTWWYVTGQLNRNQRVVKVGSQFGWAEITPPDGHFSLIRKTDVDVSGNTGDVRGGTPAQVRAGAFGEVRFNRIQTLLPPGEKVTILNHWGPFYQILPPKGATVFVAGSYLSPASPSAQRSLDRPVVPVTPRAGSDQSVSPTTPRSTDNGPSPAAHAGTPAQTTQPDTSAGPLTKFEQLKTTVETYRKLLQEQLDKPIAERDYAGTLARFRELKVKAETENNRGLKKYADAVILYLRQEIEVQRLVSAPSRAGSAKRIIEDARNIASAPAPAPTAAMFQASGLLRKSDALGDSSAMPNLHKLVAPVGQNIVCYLRPADPAADWSGLLGRQVQVWGKRQYRADWKTYVVQVERIEATGPAPVPPVQPPPVVEPAGRQPPVGPSTAPPTPPPDENAIFGPRFEGPPGEVIPAPVAPPPATQPEAMPKTGGEVIAPLPVLKPVPRAPLPEATLPVPTTQPGGQ